MKQNVIAQEIEVHPSTVSRELSLNTAKRGRAAGVYKTDSAQNKAKQRHHYKPKQIKFTSSMKEQAAKWLIEEKWSPEIISVVGHKTGHCPVSKEWLYQWVWECKLGNKRANKVYKNLYQHLRHGRRHRERGSRRDRRGIIQHRVSIEKRPKIVNKRRYAGDIEADFMMGKTHKGAMLVLTDRATLHTSLHKLKSRKSKVVSKSIIKKLTKAGYPLHTITFDNDQGFADHLQIAKALNVKTYFTRPNTSQDKGTVENRIGQLRRFFPKKQILV